MVNKKYLILVCYNLLSHFYLTTCSLFTSIISFIPCSLVVTKKGIKKIKFETNPAVIRSHWLNAKNWKMDLVKVLSSFPQLYPFPHTLEYHLPPIRFISSLFALNSTQQLNSTSFFFILFSPQTLDGLVKIVFVMLRHSEATSREIGLGKFLNIKFSNLLKPWFLSTYLLTH